MTIAAGQSLDLTVIAYEKPAGPLEERPAIRYVEVMHPPREEGMSQEKVR